MRVFRVFRFARLLKLKRKNNIVSGISGLAVPYVIAAMAFKTAVLAIETLPWFPNVSGISIIVSVIGFILAILLGTKLNIANVRLHSVEDAIARIVGAMRIFDKIDNLQSDVWAWSVQFEKTLIDFTDRKIASKNMRIRTDILLTRLADENVTGPNVAGFSRDVSYVLHRSNANMSQTYETFLSNVIFSYSVVVIILIPGFIGIVASGLITYVLVGIYFLIDDMDAAFRTELKESFFIADISPIIFYNSQRGSTSSSTVSLS